MPQQKVKIIMGLHPQAGWRSFKTSEDVSTIDFWDDGLIVYANGRPQYISLTTPFGHKMLVRLTQSGGLVDRIRYRRKQFELFLPENGPTWEERLPQILHYIALEHSDTGSYELEVRDMSGGEPRWDMEHDEELEEIEEFSDSFTTN